MYPEPPLLIRRALESDELPPGAGGPDGLRPKITRGVDLFLAIYNLHRSKDFWENPDTFDPDRFDRPFQNKGVEGWAGFNPALLEGQMYPNEIASDFAYLPFGGEGATFVPLFRLFLLRFCFIKICGLRFMPAHIQTRHMLAVFCGNAERKQNV